MSGDESRPVEAAGTPGLGGEDPLAFLRSQPQFAQMRALLQQNPTLLAPLLQQLAQSNPQLLTLINEHQNEFYNMINEPMDSESNSSTGSAPGTGALPTPATGGQGGAAGARQSITITQAEREAIDRVIFLTLFNIIETELIKRYFCLAQSFRFSRGYVCPSLFCMRKKWELSSELFTLTRWWWINTQYLSILRC